MHNGTKLRQYRGMGEGAKGVQNARMTAESFNANSIFYDTRAYDRGMTYSPTGEILSIKYARQNLKKSRTVIALVESGVIHLVVEKRARVGATGIFKAPYFLC